MRGSLYILHLDDDQLYLEQFAATLAKASLDVAVKVTSVSTVEDYLDVLARTTPDVAVLDVNIAGAIKGQEIAKRTKIAHPHCTVFMCSDMRGMGLVAACMGAGADDFIFKGSDERELALRIYGTWRLRVGEQVVLPTGRDAGAVGRSMQAVSVRLQRLVPSAVTAIHVRGESGTGKELVSELLAAILPKSTPFIRVNCGAIAPTLLESELFGHVKGAFTGAQSDKTGLVEAANGGWIFLDEVASLSLAAQVALLRTLENRTVRRVGGNNERQVKVRVLSATNEPIEEMIKAGRFRGDLWQRLCEATIELKPLRERLDELDALVQHFLKSMDGGPYKMAESAQGLLSAYDWHEGNVRELRNCLRAMTELAVGNMLTPLSLPKWFWDKADAKDDESPMGDAPQTSVGPREIRLSWPDGVRPTFDELQGKLLLEIAKMEAALNGKVSIRHLARVTSIPKSTLSTKLRHLVDQGLVAPDELSRLVNVGRE